MIINPFIFAAPFTNTKSLLFDGVDDYVNCGVLAPLSTQVWSTSCWVKFDTFSWNEAILSTRINGIGTSQGFDLFITSTGGELRARTYTGSGSGASITTTVSLSTWYHMVVVYDTTNISLYIDGSLIGTNTGTYASSGSDMYIGTHRALAFHNGTIDEVAIWDTALTLGNVTSIYNSGVPDDLSSLSPINWWRMGDGDTYPTLTDNGSGGNDGTMTNMSAGSIVTDVP